MWFDDMTIGNLKFLKIWDVTICQLTASDFNNVAYSFRFCDFFANPFTGQSEWHTEFHRNVTVITFALLLPTFVNDYNFLVPTNDHIMLIHISTYLAATCFGLVAAVSFKLFGCELPENGDRQKQIAAIPSEIYIGVICAYIGTEVW